jgi:hypothetical protein
MLKKALPSPTGRKAFDLALTKGILVHSKETFSEFLMHPFREIPILSAGNFLNAFQESQQ